MLRVQVKSKLLISKDNNSNPSQISFSADIEKIDTSTFAEACSKYLTVAASTTDQQVSLDSLAKADVLCVIPRSDNVSIKVVCTGQVLGDVAAMPLKKDYPFMLASNVIALYVSNSSSLAAASLEIGAAGN